METAKERKRPMDKGNIDKVALEAEVEAETEAESVAAEEQYQSMNGACSLEEETA